ncbi:Inosine-5'-monophosphate dehydrogenase [Rhodobacteraceae bacterium THAF1]|uniref:CBS domain-containing protein n=1 Tax=Palleronia sp. THAF1 TaxID=2587842 RepID=UPI000F3E895B|nr:CBS domain-containing protein [Palleronia sp. THAF1]QFU08280.1 Inosine-5'-monophosphate dehydrogenase [Palleronia sp. THAF1]VDC28873.1 Inosine-5'-monophosphate dehydrogenase [Rhodobacteraceae bacterium THAF1]
MQAEQRSGMRIKDRAEFKSKPKPLTMKKEQLVSDAVAAMCEKNYGSVMIVDDAEKVIGVVTERDIMRKIVNQNRTAPETKLEEIMTVEPRLAREDDDVVDWLRIMSNERFRRLPVVDAEGKIKAVFTQGDFVSYTWPDLMNQARQMGRAAITRNFPTVLIGGGIMLYTLIMIIVIAVVL